MKRNNHSFIAIGLMLFMLFFGAGNLIFPPFIGQQAGTNTLPAMAGFLITGCGLPLASVIAVCYSGKNLRDIASRVYPWYGIFMVCAISLTIGPFFAVPRNGSTSFELCIAPYLAEEDKQLALLCYTAVFFALVWWFSISPSKLVGRVGKVMTPIMLVLLFLLFVCYTAAPLGSWQAPVDPKYASPVSAFTSGILEGYNTMDGLAGLLFGILVADAIRDSGVTEQKAMAAQTLRCGLVAVFFMSLLYLYLAAIGASSVPVVGLTENGAPIFVAVMSYYFGAAGPAVMSAVVLLACLTTAIGLIASVSVLFNKIFPRISAPVFAAGFSLLAFAISNIGLTAIIAAAIPVLVFLYPLTVALILLTLLSGFYGDAPIVHRTATLAAALPALYDGLHAAGMTPPALDGFMSALPLASHGLAWLPIFALGLALGCILKGKRR